MTRASKLTLRVLFLASLPTAAVLALKVGALHLPIHVIVHAVLPGTHSLDEIAVRTLRLPRVLLAAEVGAALAVAGAILQGLTRNPMASPELFGVLDGCELGAAIVIYGLRSHSLVGAAFAAVLGGAATLAAVFVLTRCMRLESSSLSVVLVGYAVGIFCGCCSDVLLKWRELQFDNILRWAEGSIGGRDPSVTAGVAPLLILGIVGALVLAPALDRLQLGDEVAASLGLRIGSVQLLSLGIVLLLTSVAVVAAGPIAYVGLVAPHIARLATGLRYRSIILLSACVGATMLLLGDLAARTVLAGRFEELPLQALTVAVGAPILLCLLQARLVRR